MDKHQKLKSQLSYDQIFANLSQLPNRYAELFELWQDVSDDGWSAERLQLMDEQLSDLTDTCDRLQLKDISIKAQALQIYVSSFIDGDCKPQPEQLCKIRALFDSLRDSFPRQQRESLDPYASDTVTTLAAGVNRRAFYLAAAGDGSDKLASLLGEHRYAVTHFDQLEFLLNMLQTQLPDVVIIDTVQPDMFNALGKACLEASAGRERRIPIVVISESTDISKRAPVMQSIADAWFSATSSAQSVVAKVNELVINDSARRYRILVVDDDVSQTHYCKSVLGHAGMEVECADSVAEARNLLKVFEPDLFLLDLHMPDESGMDLIAFIRDRSRFSATPIVILSGEKNFDYRVDAISIGGDDFLTKPLRPSHLVPMVKCRVARYRMLQAQMDRPESRSSHTGLFSQEHTFEQLATAISEEARPSVLWFQIDQWSLLSSELDSHQLTLLAREAKSLFASQFDGEDCPADFGEGNMACLVGGLGMQQLEALAKRVCKVMAKHQCTSIDDIEHITLSCGICFSIAADRDAKSALADAASASTSGSERGGNQIAFYTESNIEDESARRVKIRSMLQKPMTELPLVASYQPLLVLNGKLGDQFLLQLSLALGKHANRVAKQEEIRACARSREHHRAFDRVLLVRALEIRRQQFAAGHQIRVCIQISRHTLLDDEHCNWLSDQLQKFRLSGTGISYEIELEDIMPVKEQARAMISDLRHLGVRVGVQGITSGKNLDQISDFDIDHLWLLPGKKNTAAEQCKLINRATERGRSAILVSDSKPGDLEELWNCGLGYLLCKELAPATDQIRFDVELSQESQS